jgi:signal transduction histidine kinase
MSGAQPGCRSDHVGDIGLGITAATARHHPSQLAGGGEVVAFDRSQRLSASAGATPLAARVLIADGQALVRAGFRVLLEADRRFTVVGEAATGEDAVALARRIRPDVVLIDARLPGLDSVEATSLICAEAGVAVMLLTDNGDEPMFAALRAGARGLLPKDTEPAELLTAVDALARGQARLSPSLTDRLIAELASRPEPAQPRPELLDRLTDCERKVLALTSNTASPAPLAASRARIVANADETRRRIERDLHDGSQQRLVALALELQSVKNAVPSERPDLLAQLSHLEDGLRAALDELREIARGLHPAILSEGGLRPALKSLGRRSALPVELKLGAVQRLPEPVEVAAYYVVSEALANAVKHAHASVIHVEVTVVDHALHLGIRDDGAGGADPTRGSGLVGLKDRVETLGGTITVQSPAGAGTSLQVEFPIEE